MKIKKRIFEPCTDYISGTILQRSVARWEWFNNRGLFVVYRDGIYCKSDYSLQELLSTDKPEGYIREVKNNQIKSSIKVEK